RPRTRERRVRLARAFGCSLRLRLRIACARARQRQSFRGREGGAREESRREDRPQSLPPMRGTVRPHVTPPEMPSATLYAGGPRALGTSKPGAIRAVTCACTATRGKPKKEKGRTTVSVVARRSSAPST